MNIRHNMTKATRLLPTLILSCAAFVFLPGQLPAQDAATITDAANHTHTKTILLVHGAWSDGSSYQKVIPQLQREGFHVVAVQIPLTSLDDDVATTQRALAREQGPVLLVGHSYGGVVITEAGTDPKVVGLVYLAALIPDVGESASSLLGSVPPTPLLSQLTEDEYGFETVSEQGYVDDFVEGLPKREQLVLAATQTPTSVSALGGIASSAAWKQKPSWYLITDTDRAVSTSLQQFMAKRIHASTQEVTSCHVVMLSHPEEVSSLITLAALGVSW